MNKVVLIGRLVDDPVTRASGENFVTSYRLAVDRRKGEADFINCITFGKGAEFAEKYFKKGMKIAVVGRIQTGSYTNRDGKKVYTTDVVVENQEFVERKEQSEATPAGKPEAPKDEFMEVADGFDLPFA